MSTLPDEFYNIVTRPRGGFDVSALGLVEIRDVIRTAARVERNAASGALQVVESCVDTQEAPKSKMKAPNSAYTRKVLGCGLVAHIDARVMASVQRVIQPLVMTELREALEKHVANMMSEAFSCFEAKLETRLSNIEARLEHEESRSRRGGNDKGRSKSPMKPRASVERGAAAALPAIETPSQP